jgi:hypothetical protein
MRFSMKTLLVAITFIATSCGGLLYANALLAICFTTAAFAFVLVGTLAALLSNGQAKPYWIGFAVFGAAYFGCAMFAERPIDIPSQWTIKQLGDRSIPSEPYLVTTGLLMLANPYVDQLPTRKFGVPAFFRIGWFVSIGHSVFTVLVALVGGSVGRWIGGRFAREDRSAAISGEPLARS